MISLIGLSLLSIVSTIGCQRIPFCEALKGNNGSISYSLSIPDGTKHRKFVVIKDSYWELEFTAGSDGNGQLALKDNCGTKSDFFVKKSSGRAFFDLGFATRYGTNDLTEKWTYTILVLLDTKEGSHIQELIEPKFESLPKFDSQNKTNFTSEWSFQPGFKDFKPELAFVSFSQQAENWVILIQQKLTGQSKPKFSLTKEPMKVPIKGTVKQPLTLNLPPAVESTLSFYKVKGLFGVSLDEGKNGTIFLIEWCETTDGNQPTDQSSSECSTQKSYKYCSSYEFPDDLPMRQNCNPALVTQQNLVDCSGQQTQCESQKEGPPPSENDTVPISGDSGNANKNEPQNNNNNNDGTGDSNGALWLIIAVIVIIVILVAISLALLFFRKSPKPEPPAEEATMRSQDVGADGKRPPSKGSVVTTVKSESLSIPSTRSAINSPNDKPKSKSAKK